MYSTGEKMHNWYRKEERTKSAKLHVQEMEDNFSEQLDMIAAYARVYTPDTTYKTRNGFSNCDIVLKSQDSVSAVLENASAKKKCCVLNFASYRNPGGKFLEGSSAQEESLCRESTLYNVLSRCKDFYVFNKSLGFNHNLYNSTALYTKDIVFLRSDKKVQCDVLTCAAPNYTAASLHGISLKKNEEVLNDRIRFVLDVAESEKVDTLILGAFGCGVFGQNPYAVAKDFLDLINSGYYGFSKVVFPVPNSIHNNNYEAFKKVLGR